MSATLATSVGFDPLRDKSYRETALGRDVTDFLAWMKLGGAAPRTLDQYERDLARGALMFPEKTLEAISDGDMLQIAQQFKDGERVARVSAYRSFFKFAKRSRRITVDPTDALPELRRPKQKVIDVFSDQEIDLLLGLDVVDAAPLALLFEAGLRRGEAQRIQLRHCRPESGQVVVLQGKGSRDRLVPMSARLQVLLADLALFEGLNPDSHIFYGVHTNQFGSRRRRRTPVGDGTFSRWWQRCLKEAGIRYRNPHVARHSFATIWRNRGLSLDDLQLLLGHSSIRTTSDLYVHTKMVDVAARMRDLERVVQARSEA